jgi:alginate O-acetyltransferase complex protein AlgJ
MANTDIGGGIRTIRMRDRLLSILFVLCIGLPAVLGAVGLARTSPEDERRALIDAPSFPGSLKHWRIYAAELDAYLADRIGLRPFLVAAARQLNFALNLRTINVVLQGKDGWLYWAGEQEVERHTGLRLLSTDEIDRWLAAVESYRRWLAARGIRFVFVIAPDKMTIYPEHLPDGLTLASIGPADQLMAALASRRQIDAVDLRPVLMAAKSTGEVYYHADTHWTPPGAYYGLQAIVPGRWPDGIKLPPLDAYRVERKPWITDLVSVANLQCCRSEPKQVLTPKTGSAVIDQGSNPDLGRDMSWMTSRNGTYPSVLLCGDSFSYSWMEFLPDIARRMVYVRHTTAFPVSLIELEKPDIVILEVLERYLILVPEPVTTQ